MYGQKNVFLTRLLTCQASSSLKVKTYKYIDIHDSSANLMSHILLTAH